MCLLWDTNTWITIVSSVTVSHCQSHLSNSSSRLWHCIKLSSPGQLVLTLCNSVSLWTSAPGCCRPTSLWWVQYHNNVEYMYIASTCGQSVWWWQFVTWFSLISLKSGRTKAHFSCFSDRCYIMTSKLCAQPSWNLASALVCTNNLLSHLLFMEPPWWPRGEQVGLGSIGLGLSLAIAWFP